MKSKGKILNEKLEENNCTGLTIPGGNVWKAVMEAMDEYEEQFNAKETKSDNLLNVAGVSNSVVCNIEMLPKNCYYRDITMECKGCRNNANNCC